MKYNTKKYSFIVVDNDRHMVYDSELGGCNIKNWNINRTITVDQRHKLILFLRIRLKKVEDKELIEEDNFKRN